MEKNLDLRVVKTKKNIKNTFLQLMEEIGFQKINVRLLVERANINRSTFYLHYSDKFDLLDKIEDELFGEIRKIALELPIEEFSDNEGKFFEMRFKVVKHIYANKNVFMLLTSEKGDPGFSEKFAVTMRGILCEKNLIPLLAVPQRYAFAAVTGLLTSLFGEWIKSGLQETPEEYIQIISQITKNLPKNLYNI